jgi:hypothetical protein
MDLSGIISISGRPGLYKVIAQGKNSIIVESITDKKRFPAYATDRISALDDISIYTYDGDKPLKEIFADIFAKQDGKEAPSHKESNSVLQAYILEIIPDYDEERVYPSDIKKLLQWYNMLLTSGNLKPFETPVAEGESEGEPKKKASPKKKSDSEVKEKPAAKKKPVAAASKAKAAAPKKATKQSTTKK